MPDRYADAVRARRAELRMSLAALSGTHRAELRSELAVARITGGAVLTRALRELGAQAKERVATGDRVDRARLPGEIGEAVSALARAVDAAVITELAPAVRRLAGARGLELPRGWPVIPPARSPPAIVVASARTPLLAGMVAGAVLWRTAAAAFATLPLLGLPAFGGPALAPLAVGVAVAAAVAGVVGARGALEQAALCRAIDDTLAAAGAAIDGALGRRLLELERVLGADLDRAVEHRRVDVQARLRLLTAEPEKGAR